MDCKTALKETDGDMEKAVAYLRKKGLAAAAKKAGRIASEGVVVSYIHSNYRVGVLLEVNCETDFVAATDGFKDFCKDVALQIAAMNPQALSREEMPADFVERAMPGGVVAPYLAKKGITGQRMVRSSTDYTIFNMEDPVVGGLAPERVALRRAISLATDTQREIRTLRKNMAIPAQSPVAPHLTGYDPAFKSEMSTYNPARARALLDLYGWTDRNGDGWREQPDGKPLVLQIATQPDQTSRDLDELRQKNLQAIGVRVEFKPAKWPENLKAGRAGKLQVWALASLAAAPDGQDIFSRFYGPQSGLQNIARFKHPELDRIYNQMSRLPDGPERLALFEQAKKLVVAYMPYKLGVHRYVADLMTERVVGFRRPLFWLNWYHMVDVLPGGDSPA